MSTGPLRQHLPTNYPAVERARASYDLDGAGGRVEAVDSQGVVLRGAMDGQPAARLEAAIDGALQYARDTQRLQPITNRNFDGVLEMLRNDAPLRTGSERTTFGNEQRAGIRLPGEESIPVNYALLHVRPEVEFEETLQKVPNLGQVSYGPVALVLRPEVLKRSTLAEADSSDVNRVYPPEGVVDAVAGALLRRASGDEPQQSHNVGRAVTPQLEPVLSQYPSAKALSIALAQAPITAFDIRGLPPVPEVQVYGGIKPSDIAAFRVADTAPPDKVAELRTAAARYGIPVEGGP